MTIADRYGTGQWIWKAAEALVATGLVVFILLPFHLEVSFVLELYGNQPVFCVVLLTAAIAFVIATGVHGMQQRRKKKVERAEAASNRGTL